MIGRFAPRAQRFRFLPRGQGSGGLVPPVIAVMSFLTALALAGGIALATAASGLGASLAQRATVQVVQANPDLREPQVRAVTALLGRDPAVASVRPLSRGDLERLLAPWLGEQVKARDLLPIPAMIDVDLRPGADVAALAARIRAVAPDSRLDAHARWLGPLAGAMKGLQWLAWAIVLLVTLATVAVVTLGTRSALGLYRPTIELLHMMGAEDSDIARIFQYRYLVHGTVGGIFGVACALVVIAGLGRLAGRVGAGVIGAAGLPPLGWAALLLLPAAVGVLAMVAARLSVARALEAQL